VTNYISDLSQSANVDITCSGYSYVVSAYFKVPGSISCNVQFVGDGIGLYKWVLYGGGNTAGWVQVQTTLATLPGSRYVFMFEINCDGLGPCMWIILR